MRSPVNTSGLHNTSSQRHFRTIGSSKLRELPPTLSVEEAADICGMSRNAAHRAARDGELPVLRLGRTMRVPTARLLQMLGVELQQPRAADAVER